jgi:diadenosine tetraphosphate (Ap4A) HIT family hydrolase
MNCPFCEAIDLGRTRDCGGGVHVLRDNYPISDGHLLVIPAVHAGSLSDLDPELVQRLFQVAAEEGIRMRSEGLCDDFNIGLNDGPMAGQTVPHVHIHVIPRRQGDVADPRGGVRWIIAEKADYWTRAVE